MSVTPHVIESSFVQDCIQAEELGAGMMFAAMFRDLFVFSHAAQEWFVWRGHYWERDCVGAALAAVDQVAQRVAEETIPIEARIAEHRETKNDFLRKAAEKERKKIIDYVKTLRRKTGRRNCLVFAATLPEGLGLGIKGDEFDQQPWLFGCVNGVIDCRVGLVLVESVHPALEVNGRARHPENLARAHRRVQRHHVAPDRFLLWQPRRR